MAAVVVVPLLILFVTGGSDASWCVCKSGVSDTTLQKTIDYACGAGADCSAIHQNGACFDPDTVTSHCSYAANNYYQRKVQSGATCDFSGTASLTTTDPSYSSCSYPSSASTAGSTTSTNSSFTPNGSVGLGPAGSFSTDTSDGGLSLLKAGKNSMAIILISAALVLLLDHVL